VNIARHKVRNPSNIPPTEDIECIVKYLKVLLSAISAWEAAYKKEVKAASSPAAFGHAHEKSSELHMEHLKV
jgi:PIN domain nuclease of toxin-antitoxin system